MIRIVNRILLYSYRSNAAFYEAQIYVSVNKLKKQYPPPRILNITANVDMDVQAEVHEGCDSAPPGLTLYSFATGHRYPDIHVHSFTLISLWTSCSIWRLK